MKLAVVLCLALAMVGQIAWAQQTDVQSDTAALRAQIEEMQKTIDQLKQKLDDIETAVNDPKGELQTARKDLGKLKKITVSGYVQTRYEWFSQKENGGIFQDGFNVRRARVKVTAVPTDKTSAVIQLDAGGNKVSVKDAYLTYDFAKDNTFAIGQMNWPFGYEVPYSSSKRETPERALVFRRFFPGERDRGAKIVAPVKRGTAQIGVFDGTGIETQNTLTTIPTTPPVTIKSSSNVSGDLDNHKDIVANGQWKVDNTEFGVSGYFGKGIWNPTRSGLLGVNKTRYGADFRYFGDNWAIKSEYVRGRGVDEAVATFDNSEWIDGYYTQLNYNTNPKDTLVARYSSMSVDPLAPTFDRRNTWDIGWIRWLTDKTRIKLFRQINDEESNSIDNNGYRVEWIVTY